MTDLFIYGGCAINIIGAVFLLIKATKYTSTLKKYASMPLKLAHFKNEWGHQRVLGFGLMIAGTVAVVTGCFI